MLKNDTFVGERGCKNYAPTELAKNGKDFRFVSLIMRTSFPLLTVSYASEIAYLILSRELCLCSMSYLRGECALHNFQMDSLSESRKD